MDIERFEPYWRTTFLRSWVFILFVCLVIGVGLGFYGELNSLRLLGFPLGVMVIGQGVVVFLIGLFFWFIGTQDQVDDIYGANEDL